MTAPRNNQAILAAYVRGDSIEAICAQYGCGQGWPVQLAKRAGVPLRTAADSAATKAKLRPKVPPRGGPSRANRVAVSISATVRSDIPVSLPVLRWMDAR